MMSHLFEQPREPNFYYDSHFDIDAVKILPGEYYVTVRPMLIVTVLGSCVAACIRDSVSGIGGMNHFMLPAASDLKGNRGTPASFGMHAMDVLINQLLERGAEKKNLEAKIFGGGNLIKSFTVDKVGEHNTTFIRNYLANQSIPILAEDLLGRFPRKIYFFPETGKVSVKRLVRLHNNTIVLRELAHRKLLCQDDSIRANES